MSEAPRVWDDLVDLGDETTWLIEASAGTGKTYQLANLVLRLVVECGIPVERILAITFTRAATAELRDRVRRRLVEAHARLSLRVGHDASAELALERDRVLEALAACADEERARRLAVVASALRNFDAAPISTIHGFVQRALAELAFESSEETGLELLSKANGILERIVDDTLSLLASSLDELPLPAGAVPPPERDDLLAIARAMTAAVAPRVADAPEGLPTSDLAAIVARMIEEPSRARAIFAATVRPRFEAELRRRRALTFDALLARLAERMRESGGASSPLALALRERYHAVLVDEFQDTDAAQWSALRDAFHGHRRLFLIGDPKQAIYQFRGADVHVYLEAKRAVARERRATMTTNWRSDPEVIRAVNVFYSTGPRAFDEAGFDYVEVRAARETRGIVSASPAGVVLRPFASAEGIPFSSVKVAQGAASDEAARAMHALLVGDTRIVADRELRRVSPSDLGVLVADHGQASRMRASLARRGIPAVAASKGSVFGSAPVRWLIGWLEAVADAGRGRSARRAALTPLVGWTLVELAWSLAVAERHELASARPASVVARDWDGLTERFRRAAERWPREGFAPVFERELAAHGALPRVLDLPQGERHATDLRHAFELAHSEERARRHGPAALARWLRACAEDQDGDEGRLQRLESDALAVRIETIHASKGLEYPFVFLPFAWRSKPEPTKDSVAIVNDGGVRTLRLDPNDPSVKQALATERDREALRLLYVALTRAEHGTMAWFGLHAKQGLSHPTALARLALRRPEDASLGDVALPDVQTPEGRNAVAARLTSLAERSGGTLACVDGPLVAPAERWSPPELPVTPLAAAVWPSSRTTLEGPYVVTSFSAMHTAAAVADDDEPLRLEALADGDRASLREGASRVALLAPTLDGALADAPRGLEKSGGAEYGTWVHAVFEELDFATGAMRDGRSLRVGVAEAGASLGAHDADAAADELVEKLPSILDTPLDADPRCREGTPVLEHLPRGFRLRDLPARDRRDELSFDLRLGEGTRRGRALLEREPLVSEGSRRRLIDPDALARALVSRSEATMREPGAGGPWHEAQRVRVAAGGRFLEASTGILTGSIDLVFRAQSPKTGEAAYFLADYKTNRIGSGSPAHYTSAWLDWEMARKGYPLQALLYTVALHRHLAARLGERYDYDKHVGGYLYLFVRGMTGGSARCPATGRALGVLADRWPRDVVLAVDRALDAREDAEARR